MGVPALFRWLSKKYPKIVLPVVEDSPVSVPGANGEMEEIPVDTTGPNPNGEEFDNLYLDMNGIVHPCTHPEGKPAPKTEEDMMHEVFLYTDRVVSMVRPRKLLMMAIDGVAPRAKMNQQRSRRFRAAQEAKQKEEDRQAAIAEWESMGKEVSDEYRNEKGWDSNAITPGTPFMDLLAKSLRYWVAKKLNEDPGWAGLEIIISDASVPGEGEHKIMDYIRRQRSHPSHDPNTKHVIYGLDADLIMLSLATHEPHFRVLREDVFAQDKKGRGCHTCGQMGHHSAQCTGKPKEKDKLPGEGEVASTKPALKPFIFLDVGILREYLAVELSAPVHSFPFDLERAIDDWVFLIFFVGNDFLPHLPSLEIREGAIDTLMTIWKSSLERMGGYLAEHGKVNLARAQVILDQLAEREDEIFRKRREAEERQDRNEKRRRIEQGQRQDAENRRGGTHVQNGHDYVPVRPQPLSRPATDPTSGLPARPAWSAPAAVEEPKDKQDISSMVGSNASIVANRRAIRMANLSAADMIKAELASGATAPVVSNDAKAENLSAAEMLKKELAGEEAKEDEVGEKAVEPEEVAAAVVAEAEVSMPAVDETTPRGTKRTAAQVEEEEEAEEEEDDEDDDEVDEADAFLSSAILKPAAEEKTKLPPLKMMGNNVVEQDDTVKLWEPGYKERYYRQKFGVELSDTDFRRSVVKSYVEGLCWVLEYYFQGTPSWQWYYPHHFSPFASDFTDLATLDIDFTLGAPFKPYEQLMGVFPAASRVHLPEPFQPLMTDADSPIIDFYPEEFEIDMNGKKMVWQGVALLPFIDPKRLLEAMGTRYPQLSEFENARNTRGSDTLFVMQEHPLYDYLEGLYTKRKIKDPVEIDTKRSKGLAGSVLPDPACVPGVAYESPLPSQPDIEGDRSISASYCFPSQRTPHRSVLLPGVEVNRPQLNPHDRDQVRRGGGEGGGHRGNGFHHQRQQDQRGPGFAKSDRGGGRYNNGGGGGGQQAQSYPQGGSMPPGAGGYSGQPQQGYQAPAPYAGYGGYGGGYGGYGQGGAPPVAAYGGPAGGYQPPPPPQPQGTYRSLPPGMNMGGYRPPMPPPPGGAGYPSPRGYGAPQPPAPPPAQGYGGYGGSYGGYGQGSQGGQQGGYRR